MLIDLQNLNLNNRTELCDIMTSNMSDKGINRHNYTIIYHTLFNHMRQQNLNIFELGLGTNNVDVPSNMGPGGRPGASLYGWSQYFRNSLIYGADIDKRILFNYKNIKTFYCDQTSKESIQELWKNFDDVNFDIIIEDGLHTYEANISFLENSLHKVKKSGYYIIEDIKRDDVDKFEKYMNNTKLNIKEWQLLPIPNSLNDYDNILMIIKV